MYYNTQVADMTEKNEFLTEEQPIQLKKIGNSQGFTVPAAFLKIKNLKTGPLLFYAHVEKDLHGNLSIVFVKSRSNPTEILHNRTEVNR